MFQARKVEWVCQAFVETKALVDYRDCKDKMGNQDCQDPKAKWASMDWLDRQASPDSKVMRECQAFQGQKVNVDSMDWMERLEYTDQKVTQEYQEHRDCQDWMEFPERKVCPAYRDQKEKLALVSLGPKATAAYQDCPAKMDCPALRA